MAEATKKGEKGPRTCWRNRRRDSGGPATEESGHQIEGARAPVTVAARTPNIIEGNADMRVHCKRQPLIGERIGFPVYATLVVFICNHCPYVKAAIGRIVEEAKALCASASAQLRSCRMTPRRIPEDSFDNMKTFAARHSFVFPYVIDTTQEVARAYGAQCTPDFFGFNMKDELQYRGRLDASRTTLIANRRDLFEAMKQVAETVHGPEQQMPSMGCSIKWKQ
jgi:redoxin